MRLSPLRHLLVAVSLGTVLFVVAPTRPTFASSVPSIGSGVAGGGTGLYAQVQIPIPNFDFNPTKWVQDAFAALLQSFSDGIQAGMNAIWDANFITQTPPTLTYQNEDIRGLYGTMRGAANAALAAIATLGAMNGLLRPHLGFRYHSLSELVPRILVGGILVNTALWWVQFAIDVNNALAASVGNATPRTGTH